MQLYFAIFFLLAFFSFFEIINSNKKLTHLFYGVFCLVFFVMSFIRFEVGTDWDNYYNFFKNIGSVDLATDSFEFGFGLINKWVSYFTNEYSILLFVLGAILFSFQSFAIKRMSPYPLISLLFLWSTQFANILFVRQWIAIAILFFSIKYIERNRFVYFVFFVLLACLFHRTSFFFILAWWVYKNNWSIKTKLIILLLSILASAAIMNILQLLSGSMGGILQAKLSFYLDKDYNKEANEELSLVKIIIRGFANKFLILGIGFYILHKASYKIDKFKGYLNLYWFGAVVYFCVISISVVFVRLSYAFDMLQIVLVPYFLQYFTDKRSRAILFFIFCIYAALRMWQVLDGPYAEELTPYKTIFN
nr:EpsG family protein [uncultured Pedobacter sp.]